MPTKRDNFTARIRPDLRARLDSLAKRPDLRSRAYVLERCLEIALPVIESSTPTQYHELEKPASKAKKPRGGSVTVDIP